MQIIRKKQGSKKKVPLAHIREVNTVNIMDSLCSVVGDTIYHQNMNTPESYEVFESDDMSGFQMCKICLSIHQYGYNKIYKDYLAYKENKNNV
jgi:hypothetical protein